MSLPDFDVTFSLPDAINAHLKRNALSAKAFAQETGINYQTLLGIIKNGNIPRKAEHREVLRAAIGVDEDTWVTILANSGRAPVNLPSSGPMTLQQMVTKALYAKGLNEQRLSKECGVAYPTVLGITRKGAVPRIESLRTISDALDLDWDEVMTAVNTSRSSRYQSRHDAADAAENARTLTELVAQHLSETGKTVAGLAKGMGAGYIAVSRLLKDPSQANDTQLLSGLAQALELTPDQLAAAIQLDRVSDQPSSVVVRGTHPIPKDASPLQKALIGHMNRSNLTIKAMAEKADLSQLTMTRLLKGQTQPARSTTHQKLQELLGISKDAYLQLLSPGGDLSAGPIAAEAPVANPYESINQYGAEMEEIMRKIEGLSSEQRGVIKRYLNMIDEEDG